MIKNTSFSKSDIIRNALLWKSCCIALVEVFIMNAIEVRSVALKKSYNERKKKQKINILLFFKRDNNFK